MAEINDATFTEMHGALAHLAQHFTEVEWYELSKAYMDIAKHSEPGDRAERAKALSAASLALWRYVEIYRTLAKA